MPPSFYNATQAAFEIGISYRTIRRRIETGQIRATRGADGQYSIAAAEVERLKQAQSERPRPAISSQEETGQERTALEKRVADLEARVRTLEDMASHVSSPHPATTRARPQKHATTTKNELPQGCILASTFAANHGVNRSTFTEHMLHGRGLGLIGSSTDMIPERDRVDYSERPKPGRPKETERFLDQNQQRQALAFWRRHGVSFIQCQSAECWCSNS